MDVLFGLRRNYNQFQKELKAFSLLFIFHCISLQVSSMPDSTSALTKQACRPKSSKGKPLDSEKRCTVLGNSKAAKAVPILEIEKHASAVLF